jgi:hypothetical protein
MQHDVYDDFKGNQNVTAIIISEADASKHSVR